MFEAGGASGGVEAADAAELLTARHARIAREQCLEIESVTDLFIVRCEEDARAGRNEARHGEFAHVEVAGILGLTESAAQRMIGLGCDLRWRLSRVRAAFAAGRIDLAKAHALAEILAKVSDEVLAEIEERLLDGADRTSTTRLRNRGRRLIARLDPEGARERRRRATADRDARVIARDDGWPRSTVCCPPRVAGSWPVGSGRCVSTCAPRIRAPMRSAAPTHWSRSLRGTHTSTALAGATTAPPTRAFPRVTIAPPVRASRCRSWSASTRRHCSGSTTPPATCSATAPSTPIWRGISLGTARGNGCSPSPIAIAIGSHQRQPVRQARSSVSAPHFRRRDRHPPMSRCAFANIPT